MADDKKAIYFVRHAKDDDRYRGGWSKRPLIRDGELQARVLSNFIYEKREQYNISSIISSDLQRCMQTALPLSTSLSLPIAKSFEWREINNGKLAGIIHKEAERKYPGLYWSTLDMDQPFPGGETPRQFFERISAAYSALCQQVLTNEVPSNTIVFTHSGVINIIYSIVNNIQWSNKKRSFNIPHASVHKLNLSSCEIKQVFKP